MSTNSFTKKQLEYYNLHAHKFNKRLCYTRQNRNHYKKIKKIIDELSTDQSQSVLEIGSGTGIHATWLLHNKRGKVSYTGIDISHSMLSLASTKLQSHNYNNNAVFLTADANKLPFKKGSFDIVFCSGTLHHIAHPEKAINEMIETLKNNGKLIIIEPQPLFPTNFLVALTNPIERNIFRMTKKNLLCWTKQKLKRTRIENFLYTPPFPKGLGQIYDLVDSIAPHIPVIRHFSIMLYLYGEKV